jgi:hypothetical protein
MELIDFLAESTDVGNFCDRVYGGITEVYLVPAGGGFSLFLKPSEILELPTLDVSPFRIVLEPESCELRCRNIFDKNGSKFENTIIFRNIRKVYEWLHENRYKSFWVILKQGETRCLVTGDDDMPYRYAADYAVEKEMQNEAAFTVSLKSTQLRPFHVIRFRFVVLDPNDWQEQTPYIGEWTLEKGAATQPNDFVKFEGNIYSKESNRTSFENPAGNDDYAFLGPFSGSWEKDGVYSGGITYVEFNGKLYYHLTLTNGYTYVYL